MQQFTKETKISALLPWSLHSNGRRHVIHKYPYICQVVTKPLNENKTG